MKLHGFWRSTATWRVRIALEHKGLAYALEPVNLRKDGGEQHREEFRALNPMRQVPVLEIEDGGVVRRLAQSMAIVEYLEERFPEPALLPDDRFLRARTRQLAQMIVAGIQPLQNTGVQQWVREELGADEKAWARHWVTLGLDALEAVVGETAGKHCVGDTVSIADLCLAPQLFFARRFSIDMDRYPQLVRIESVCAELPAFQRAHASRQPDAESD